MQKYLESSRYVNWNNENVCAKACQLAKGMKSDVEIARTCFLFVRDTIQHSGDYSLNPVTCKASDVLHYQTGFCYAKSHLLAALLRASNIPSGLCYQRLTVENNIPPFCLHGLNAVYLKRFSWYRIDARGNKIGVNADFCPPKEQLAFPVITAGEADLEGIWTEPHPEVIRVLENSASYNDVIQHLPDIEITNEL